MKKLISLAVATMFMVPSFAMALPKEDPCPEGPPLGKVELPYKGKEKVRIMHKKPAKKSVKRSAKKH